MNFKCKVQFRILFCSKTILLLLLMASCSTKTEVDLIVFNAIIHSVDPDMNMHNSMVINDGKIVAIGSYHDFSDRYKATKVIDYSTNHIYPGFIDAHCHFLGYGRSLFNADLTGTKSFEEVLERVVSHNKKFPAEWIMGRGWDQNDWEIKEFPNKTKLDELFPDNPVFLRRVDGHAVLVNQKVLDMIDLRLVKFADNLVPLKDGEPIGIFIDEAIDLIAPFLPTHSESSNRQALMIAQKDCFAVGLTSVTDAGLLKNELEIIEKMHAESSLKMNIAAMVSGYDSANLEYYMNQKPRRTDHLNISAVKFYADGALGSRGACLLAPYLDHPNNHGAMINDLDWYKEQFKKAYDAGYQVCTHAIGDSANRVILDLYSDLLTADNDRRWRIEHAQVIHPKDFDRFGRKHIIPSIQTTHATSDMYWADERLGEERLKGAYAYQELLQQNGFIPNGSDFPVENINPLFGFYAAITRQDHEGYPEGGFQIKNALTREQALKAMTIWAAYSAFEEDLKGSLEVGKNADFVVLNRDIMTIPPDEILHTLVLGTYISGEMVHGVDFMIDYESKNQ